MPRRKPVLTGQQHRLLDEYAGTFSSFWLRSLWAVPRDRNDNFEPRGSRTKGRPGWAGKPSITHSAYSTCMLS